MEHSALWTLASPYNIAGEEPETEHPIIKPLGCLFIIDLYNQSNLLQIIIK